MDQRAMREEILAYKRERILEEAVKLFYERGFTGTTLDDIAAELGVNECRRRRGWYAERAAAGQSFLITRRGRPYARPSPPFDQLTEAPAVDERPKLEIVT